MKRNPVTRKQFQEWLNKFPEDTLIEVAIQNAPDAYQAYGSVSFESPDIESGQEDGWSFTDFTNNQFVKPTDEIYGKKFLELGEGR